ncbi:DUF4136 domain-containing protein [Polaribacter glomeratus]|uniref:DUF4136 domain-containing protein n=1 Tax=Polaribacter glomeratus TaxID=102 RepID=A0A2S7WYD5_9FLAO|nr:DUF4136 domain-containing protein [Polaribacter glomeratus]PQJ82597.1 hypothetical protein BTO16_08415 [Polaribacter glomeratus]TXD64947.1 DUF4136 domain-containing protein [Polaribacter glomeratus]
MKNLKYLFFILLMSCSSAKVMTDFDNAINFSDFKTYGYYEDVGKGLNELDIKRVISALNLEMEQNGFADLDNPDFFINITSKISESRNRNSIGIGLGNGGFGLSGGIPIGGKKLNEEFVIEFVNSKTNQVIWEGILNSKIKEKRTPEEKEAHFQKVITKILEKYPPKS